MGFSALGEPLFLPSFFSLSPLFFWQNPSSVSANSITHFCELTLCLRASDYSQSKDLRIAGAESGTASGSFTDQSNTETGAVPAEPVPRRSTLKSTASRASRCGRPYRAGAVPICWSRSPLRRARRSRSRLPNLLSASYLISEFISPNHLTIWSRLSLPTVLTSTSTSTPMLRALAYEPPNQPIPLPSLLRLKLFATSLSHNLSC